MKAFIDLYESFHRSLWKISSISMKAFVGSQICNESVALFASRPADKSFRRRRSKLHRFVDN
jgi:hypothetical protein